MATCKFKVGDKVIGNHPDMYGITKKGWIGEVLSIQPGCIKVRGVGIGGVTTKFWVDPYYFDLYAPAEEKIVITHDGKITTATKYCADGNKVTATARCAPEDDFNFRVGAELAFERLMEKIDLPKYYNGKVVCVANEFPPSEPVSKFTVGKVYNVVDGVIISDTDYMSKRYNTVEHLCIGIGHKFIPLVE